MSGLLSGIGSSLIGGLGSLFTSNSANKFAARQNQLNRDFAHNEALLSFERNWKMMDYQNQYNSPENQRKLFEQAGINYNNIVGNAAGTSVSKSNGGSSPASAPGSIGAQQMNMEWANNIANIGLIDAQRKKTLAEAGAIEHQNNLTDSQTGYYSLLSAGQELQNGITEKYGSLEAFARVNNLESDSAFKDAERMLIHTQDKLGQFDLSELKPLQQADYIARIINTEIDGDYKKALTAKTEAERKEILSLLSFKVAYTLSAIRLNNEQSSYVRSQKLKNFTEIGLINQQKDESWSRMNLNNWDSKLKHNQFNVLERAYKELYPRFEDAAKKGLRLKSMQLDKYINQFDIYSGLDGLNIMGSGYHSPAPDVSWPFR